MDNKKSIVLNQYLGKNRVNEDIIFPISLEQTNKPLPVEPLVEIVDISKVFQGERDESPCYRFLGNLNIVASNVLFNWTGEKSYEDIVEARQYNDTLEEYTFTQDEILKEEDGWFYYLTGDTEVNKCDRTYLEPLQDRLSLYNISGDTNWNVWLTYPAEKNVTTLVFNDVPITDGIALYSGASIVIEDRVMTAFICSINHGLSIGDEIQITSTTTTGYEGIHNIYQLGFGDGSYLTNTFIIDIDLGLVPSFIGTQTSFKRRIDGIASEYNGRWFKKISRLSDIEVFNTAFATNIYKDQIFSYNFNTDYNLSIYDDYLGRPLTEVYLTVVKKQDIVAFGNNEPFWTFVESGLKTVLELSEYDINTINTTTYNDSIEADLNNNLDTIFGDIMEFNPVSQTETVLEIAYHRFNTKNREDNNFLEGYYHQPHYKMQIRQFSDYVESAFSTEIGIPYYATIFNDGRAVWRDVMPNDFSNQAHIPFVNGCHYIYRSTNLLIQRQDPCNDFDLGNVSFVIGNCDKDEQFNEVALDDFCD